MFDRGNRAQESLRPSVRLTLSDGRELSGTVVVSLGRTLVEVLNTASSFIEFEPAGAPRIFIAKSDVRSVLPLNVAPAPSLPPLLGDDVFNPFAVLGVTSEADKEEVHRAYVHLAKIYHPDRYATTGLPAEVCDYLSSMARRINAAYAAAEAARQKPTVEGVLQRATVRQ
jgi:DnaJ domain